MGQSVQIDSFYCLNEINDPDPSYWRAYAYVHTLAYVWATMGKPKQCRSPPLTNLVS